MSYQCQCYSTTTILYGEGKPQPFVSVEPNQEWQHAWDMVRLSGTSAAGAILLDEFAATELLTVYAGEQPTCWSSIRGERFSSFYIKLSLWLSLFSRPASRLTAPEPKRDPGMQPSFFGQSFSGQSNGCLHKFPSPKYNQPPFVSFVVRSKDYNEGLRTTIFTTMFGYNKSWILSGKCLGCPKPPSHTCDLKF